MENRKILIDTTIVIDYLRAGNKEKSYFVKLYKDFDLYMSVISVFELFNGATSEQKKLDVETICDVLELIDFDVHTAKLSSELYQDLLQKNKMIEFRDILIGATALQYNILIATLNVKHFERIRNLEIVEL